MPEDFDHPDVGDLQDGDGDEEVSRNKIMVVIWLETKYGFLSAHGARGMKTCRDIRSYFQYQMLQTIPIWSNNRESAMKVPNMLVFKFVLPKAKDNHDNHFLEMLHATGVIEAN